MEGAEVADAAAQLRLASEAAVRGGAAGGAALVRPPQLPGAQLGADEAE